MAIERKLTDVVEASNRLTDIVDRKMSAIDNRVNNQIQLIDQKYNKIENDFNNYISNARSEYPVYRQSKNQFGNLSGNNLVGFGKNPLGTVNVSLYREIHSHIEWNKRDKEELEILTAMGLHGQQYFFPDIIRVIKLEWSGFDKNPASNKYTIYPAPRMNLSVCGTSASYAKLIRGKISGFWLQGVNHEWGLCGINQEMNSNRYIHATPVVGTDSGEVLFIWAASVVGFVSLDRRNPRWAHYPSPYASDALDTTQ